MLPHLPIAQQIASSNEKKRRREPQSKDVNWEEETLYGLGGRGWIATKEEGPKGTEGLLGGKDCYSGGKEEGMNFGEEDSRTKGTLAQLASVKFNDSFHTYWPVHVRRVR